MPHAGLAAKPVIHTHLQRPVQVVHAPAPVAAAQALQGGCCQPAPIPSPPSEAVVKKEQKIREVHISAALMEEFLRFAHL